MKRLYILISFLCLIGAATAQNSNQNYVVTRTMLNESSSSYLDVVKYYDGLGRLCQTVHNQVTPQKNNLLDLSEYDESGRDVKDWKQSRKKQTQTNKQRMNIRAASL